MKITSVLTLLFVVLLLASCEKDEACKAYPLAVTSLEAQYGCSDTRRSLDIELVENYTIIRSQAAFDSQVSGNCKPQIDFTSYDLVIGK